MRAASLVLPLWCVAACLPQVGPPVPDGAVADDDGGAGGGGGGGGGASGGGAGGGFVDTGCPGFAGCLVFEDHTGLADRRTITFPNGNDRYVPKCMRVKVGQTVTFTGGFSGHPMLQACGPSPRVVEASGGTSAQFTFSVAGTYGYYCDRHGTSSGNGMAGAIEVVN